MSKFIHKSHNVSVLLYHLVCPVKYRKVLFDDAIVTYTLKQTCLEIAERYEVEFLEIGVDMNHVHFLIQSVPMYSPTKLLRLIKSITAREIRANHPELKRKMWGGKFWSSGSYIETIGRRRSEEAIRQYVKEQGQVKHYREVHRQQLSLF